ncbi:MAG TPA: hypothetical protein VL172_20025, partial [Kofleriaceae bacterium]|nr:hypothetical protein [Kofleriaceae bacterium]
MSARRLLLIDNDPAFRRTLNEQLVPYGFEIHLADQGSADALGHVREIKPVIIFIAVEEPDKVGYSLCNKAKKGVASNIPVVLTTKTVPKKGFLSHKKLKVHADEYIDKRSMTPAELIEKIDQLIGLGDVPKARPGDELEIPMEVEEVSLDEEVEVEASPPEEMEVDEIEAGGHEDDDFDDNGERTSIAAPSLLLDSGVAEETDAAFAALTSDPAIELSELDIEEPGLPEPPPVAKDKPKEAEVKEEPRKAEVKEEPKKAAAKEPEPKKPEPAPEPPRAADLAPLPAAPVPAAAESVPDLGLDAVVEMAVEEASGVTDRKSLQKIHHLETENRRLKAELEQSKSAAPGGAGEPAYSREREFLNLREVINKKEREVLNLQDEIAAKERQILDGKDKIRRLEHAKASADSKNLELEQRILEQMESRTTMERDKQAAAGKAEQLAARVTALEAELA